MVELNYNVTHTDLDGISCGILLKKLDSNIETIYANYGDVDNTLLALQQPANIYISDISCSKSTLMELLDKGNKVVVLDHHKTALWLNDISHPNLYCKVDTSKSGTKLCYEYVNNHGVDVTSYHDYVEAVNSHDLWLRDNDASDTLAMLFSLLGRDAFIDRYTENPDITVTPQEQLLLDVEIRRRTDIIEKAIKRVVVLTDSKGYTYGVVYAQSYISEIGNAILNAIPELAYVAIIGLHIRPTPDNKLGVVSLRSANKVDVSEIAHLHKGGGHPNAAGFILENWDPKYFNEDLRVNI